MRSVVPLFGLLSIIVLMLFSGDALAREKDATRASGAIDARSFEILSQAQELTDAGRYDEAVRALDKIKHSGKLNGYAKSQMWNFYAYIYATQEKYPQAIDAYQQILLEPDAPDGLKLTAKYTLAQLHFQLGNYAAVVNLMEAWLKEISKPTATAHIILAQCYFQDESYDAALRHLNTAITIEREEGQAPKENWLRMKAAIYFELKDTKNTLKTYEQLLHHFPKIGYLKQIAGLHGELGNDRQRLTTYDAVFLQGGLMRESELLNLAYMYLGQEIPYKAGKLIEAGMAQGVIKQSPQNVETLANAWAHANEHKKAIPVLERAAKLSGKGLLYARLAGVYFDAGDFALAAQAAKHADEKGGLKQRDSNHMLMGMALFNTKDFEGALQAFRQAKSSKKSFSDARKWERYTLSELERLKAIQEREFKLVKKTKEALDADENNADAIGRGMRDNQSDENAQ